MAATVNYNSTTPVHHCVVCSLWASSRCSRCKSMYYCSAAHQRTNWPQHKSVCKPSSPNAVPSLEQLCALSLRAFECTHLGMHGTALVHATFPKENEFVVQTRSTGASLMEHPVRSIQQWLGINDDQTSLITDDQMKAYWITRLYNDCTTITVSLLEAIQSTIPSCMCLP